MTRSGIGFDSHCFIEGRPLILGGVEIPHNKGLAGHSDADALLHAICDALLGAVALGDIGLHFPDNDPQYKGIDSTKLLCRVVKMVHQQGWEVVNCDAVIITELPKLQPYIALMREKLAGWLQVGYGDVSVKGKTNEGMGALGRQEGMAVMSIVTVKKREME